MVFLFDVESNVLLGLLKLGISIIVLMCFDVIVFWSICVMVFNGLLEGSGSIFNLSIFMRCRVLKYVGLFMAMVFLGWVSVCRLSVIVFI